MKKRPLEKGELGFVTVLGVVSLIALIASFKMFLTAPSLNGEGTVPLITACILVCMVIIMLVEMRGCPRGFEKGTALAQKAKELFQFLFPGMVGIIVVYCIVYALLLKRLGFAVSTLVFLFASMVTLNREHKVRSFVISAITLACIMVLFQSIFKVQLP